MSKIDHSLFNADEHALQHAYGNCPLCQAKLQIRSGKSGPFLGCSRYPECHFSKALHEYQSHEVKVIDGAFCPECQSPLAVKKGRYGLFIGCTNFPQCHHIEKLEQKQESLVSCPLCRAGKLHRRTNKYGKNFFACDGYPDCRYLLNYPPVAKSCPACGWPIMMRKGHALVCPQKACQHKEADG